MIAVGVVHVNLCPYVMAVCAIFMYIRGHGGITYLADNVEPKQRSLLSVLISNPPVTTVFCLAVLSPRPPGPVERQAHRAAPGDGAAFTGTAAQSQPPGLPAAVRQTAPEDDRPATDRHRSRAPHAAAQEDRGGHVAASAATGDHEGLVLEMRPRRTGEVATSGD